MFPIHNCSYGQELSLPEAHQPFNSTVQTFPEQPPTSLNLPQSCSKRTRIERQICSQLRHPPCRDRGGHPLGRCFGFVRHSGWLPKLHLLQPIVCDVVGLSTYSPALQGSRRYHAVCCITNVLFFVHQWASLDQSVSLGDRKGGHLRSWNYSHDPTATVKPKQPPNSNSQAR